MMVSVTFSKSISLLLVGLFEIGLCWRRQELVIIDTDPGIDDAVALFTMLGDRNVKVVGITCVRGNADVPDVIINTFKILKVANALKIPVYSGQNFGYVDSPRSDHWFGKDGLWDLPFWNPPKLTKLNSRHAAAFLAAEVMKNPGKITILAIGPLTNIALAIHLNSNFLKQAKKIVILGGSVRGQGNVAPGVEFNFYLDPDAAAFVLNRAFVDGVLLTHVPMETVLDYELGKDWRWNELVEISNPVVSYLNTLELKHQEMRPADIYIPFDVYAAAIILSRNAALKTTKLYGLVENKGEKSKGVLLVDYINVTNNRGNLEVIQAVNTNVIRELMMNNLANFK